MWEDRRQHIDPRRIAHLWAQVAADLRTEITAGRLDDGQRLPAEPELASIYGVSRATIRRALGVLIDEGLLSRLTGRGTFVTPAADRPQASS